LDGNVIASSGFTFNANTTFANNTLGAWNRQSNDGNVRAGISEVLIYSSALTTPERQQIEGYLATKWGLVSSLPTIHDFKRVLPATAAFNPRQISNCALWLDAADEYSLTLSGSNVTQWRDKSGLGNHMNQYSAATAPTTSNLNGRNTVYFFTTSPTSTQTVEPFTNVKVLQGTNFQTTSNSTIFLVVHPLYTTTDTKFIVNLK
jgi:hypothetical protein